MLLPRHHYLEFQRIYEKVYKEKISYEEAVKKADGLVNLVDIVYVGIEKGMIDPEKIREAKARKPRK